MSQAIIIKPLKAADLHFDWTCMKVCFIALSDKLKEALYGNLLVWCDFQWQWCKVRTDFT